MKWNSTFLIQVKRTVRTNEDSRIQRIFAARIEAQDRSRSRIQEERTAKEYKLKKNFPFEALLNLEALKLKVKPKTYSTLHASDR